MPYQTFYFRAPSKEKFFSDVEQVCSENEIDPYEKGVLEKNEEGIDGEPPVSGGFGVSVIPAGKWFITQPQWEDLDEEGVTPNKTQQGVKGDYCLVNVNTKDPELKNLIEQFAASDPAKSPSEIADSEKIGSGTHRIDGSMISSPVRTW